MAKINSFTQQTWCVCRSALLQQKKQINILNKK